MKKGIGLWGWIGIIILIGIVIKFWWVFVIGVFIYLGYLIYHKYALNSKHKTRNTILTWSAVFLLSISCIGVVFDNSDSTTATKSTSEQKTVKVTKTANHKKANPSEDKKKSKVGKQLNTDDLVNLQYTGAQTIAVNGGNPSFSTDDLSTAKGSWQDYGNLDSQNRPTHADALINHAMQPTAKREPLNVNPTGWRNKKIKSGYLYNRSHLIGYQLTGQNNNPKNLITGTRSMNSPEMLHYEDDIAYYLKTNPNGYVRYQVVPVFKDNELVARGVHMQAQSVGDNSVRFNVYIFNTQDGVEINYSDGTSKVSANETNKKQPTISSSSAESESSTTDNSVTAVSGNDDGSNGDMNTADTGRIVGNVNSHIYHVPGQSGYNMNSSNAVYFNSEQAAQAAGYRKSLR
ncbi:DNA-entry nuclease [Paucilactobacillus hokkaidonensis JCM 18461]|uniref:DNA-entry nuclease n=2 Tax=Paucilactobacillus hokkaidonensis TaxID=1193095 RepID=A0A0A1GV44_9LACO|nr:DNA/RNA non-specific endonuclease [Paucilactobacillus hokkaidonensis]KRO09512.1 DNA-entry nuclease [Paucilactobacillus hokkaidonensis]BAP84688.1 DNA-entry nuclease [Paucilactobacillus hokkaidonensis JCM 18461]